jgi:hypothetical protein
MINLLPEKQKFEVLREYHWRVAVVALWMVVVLLVVAIILLIPSIVLSQYQLDLSNNKIATPEKTATQSVSEVRQKIVYTKQLAGVLVKKESARTPSTIISMIVSYKTPALKMTGITIAPDMKTITIDGTSGDRAALVNFKANLKDDPMVESVDLPVSTLAQNIDIPFMIKVVLKPDTQ